MDLGINGKKALVCGGSRGIGRAIALALAKEGADLYLCSRSEDSLKETKEHLEKESSSQIFTRAVDLASQKDREALIEDVLAKFGKVDILVNNTGGPKPSTPEETSLEDWQKGFDQLFQSTAHLTNAFLPSMKENKWGRILTVTSLTVQEPVKTIAVSNAIRSAVTSMLKALATDVAPFNITVNCIAPGAIKTERLDQLMEARIKRSGQSKEEYEKEYLSQIPMARLGRPEEFGEAAAFLCSQSASYITGSTICVDGGKRKSTY